MSTKACGLCGNTNEADLEPGGGMEWSCGPGLKAMACLPRTIKRFAEEYAKRIKDQRREQ